MSSSMAATFVSLLFLTAQAARAEDPPYQYRVEGEILWVTAPDGRNHQLTSPCTGLALINDDENLYVACGDDGVAVFSIKQRSTPQLVGVRDLGGRVTGFHRSGDSIWVEVVRNEARLLGGSRLRPPAELSAAVPAPPALAGEPTVAVLGTVPVTPSRPAASEAAESVGRVVESFSTHVIIDLGEQQGIAVGDHVALFDVERVDLSGSTAERERLHSVGTVSAASPDRAQVELGRNEAIAAGALARKTTAPVTASRILPPHPTGAWEITFALRPFLALGGEGLGLGTVSDATVGLRVEPGIHLLAVAEPLGFGFAEDGNVIAAAGNLIATYDTQLFEIGLGVGWSAVNNDIESARGNVAAAENAGGIQPRFENVRSGLSLAQMARLGAVDGLSVTVRNTFLLYDDSFYYGGTVGRLQVPVSARSWIVGNGGFGYSGFYFGEAGLRVLLLGNGRRDSLFLTAAVGGGGLFGEKKTKCMSWDAATGTQIETPGKCFESVSYGGPTLGLAVEWRI